MEWADYSKILMEKSRMAGIPSAATFELTPFCNFNCNMCYIRLSPKQAKKQGKLLTTDQWLQIADETKRLGVIGIELTGGEAVTRSDFPILYESFIKMGYLISLRSNGYLLTGDRLELLRKYKPRSVFITLYGGSDETYQKVCGVTDGFTVVTNNILALRQVGIVPHITVTMTKDNMGDRELLKKWAENNNFSIAFFGGLFTPIRSAKRSIEHLKADFYLDDIENTTDITSRLVPDREKYMHPFWMCGNYGGKFCISWDGRMTVCNCLPSVWSEPLSQGIADAYRFLYEQLSLVKRPPECYDCLYIDYCGACPARFLSDTGNHERTCESICRIAKLKFNRTEMQGQQRDKLKGSV